LGAGARPIHAECLYKRHRPEETVLFKLLQAHWKTFLHQFGVCHRAAGAARLCDLPERRYLKGNPRYPTCQAVALRDRVLAGATVPPPMIMISETDDSATCN
jgi:hypothetical protein